MSNNASFHTFHKCSAIKSKQTRIKKWSQSRRRIKSKLTWFSPICYCVTLILLQHFLQNFLLQLSAQVLALIQEYLSNPRLCMFFFFCCPECNTVLTWEYCLLAFRYGASKHGAFPNDIAYFQMILHSTALCLSVCPVSAVKLRIRKY